MAASINDIKEKVAHINEHEMWGKGEGLVMDEKQFMIKFSRQRDGEDFDMHAGRLTLNEAMMWLNGFDAGLYMAEFEASRKRFLHMGKA